MNEAHLSPSLKAIEIKGLNKTCVFQNSKHTMSLSNYDKHKLCLYIALK